MKSRTLVVAAVVLLISPRAHAQTPARPLSLTATLDLRHSMRDMMTFLNSHYEVTTTLHVDAAGRAELHLQGTFISEVVNIARSAADAGGRVSSSTPTPVDEVWTGRAHRVADHVVIQFDATSAYRPVVSVDVAWECVPQDAAIGSETVHAWRCETAQALSRASSSGYPLVPYMQVPMFLAAPAERLSVDAHATGGANHRATLSAVTYTRRAR